MANEIQMSETQGAEHDGARAKEVQTGGCCGGAAPEGVDACCALDAEVKAEGGAGCGCTPRATKRGSQNGRCC